jgi:hypothetical protein
MLTVFRRRCSELGTVTGREDSAGREPRMRVGLVDCGLPLCRTTWTHAQFSWEIDPRVKSRATALPECPRPNVSYESVAKSPVKLLKSNTVDLLVIDHGRHDRAASFFQLRAPR